MSGWPGRELLPITWSDVVIMFLPPAGVRPDHPLCGTEPQLHTMMEICARRGPAGGRA